MPVIAGAKVFIAPNVTDTSAITQLTGDVTAGPGPGSKAATLVATANVKGLIAEYGDPFINVQAPPYNATGNTVFNIAGNGHITSGLAILTSATGTWTGADVGKSIVVAGAGVAGAPLSTTILSFQSATQVTLNATAGTTVTTAVFFYGTDDTAAIQAAITAVAAGLGGIVWLPAGNYLVSSTLTIDPTKVSLQGPGANDVTILPTTAITGDVMRVTEATFVATIQSNKFGGFTIDGTGAGVGSCGFHYGDTIGGELNDLVVQNFTTTGGIGIHMDNHTNWTERLVWFRVWVNNNKIGVLFDVTGGTTSFGYQRIMQLNVNANANQTGIQFQAGAHLYNGVMFISGNFNSAGCTFLNLTGSSTLGPAVVFDIEGEMDTAGATGLLIGAGSGISGGSGCIDFSTAGTANTNSGYIQFGGWFNVLGIHTASEGVTAVGGLSVANGPNYPSISGGGAINADGTNIFISANTGLVVFRPNGPGSGTGQTTISTAGSVSSPGSLGLNASAVPSVVGTVATVPPTQTTIQTALGNLVLGTAFQNTLSYDVQMTVYLSVTVDTSLVIKLGVGTTTTPTQQTIITGVTTIGFLPVSFVIPAGQYALLSVSGTGSETIVGQWLQSPL
jgi:hypothetical protein